MDKETQDIINTLRYNHHEDAATLIENLLFKVDVLAAEIEDISIEMDALEDDLQGMHEDQAGASI